MESEKYSKKNFHSVQIWQTWEVHNGQDFQ